jgi:hypothetical protein
MPGAKGFGDLLLELLGKEGTEAAPVVAKAYRGAWHPELWPPAAEPSSMGADEAGRFWSSSDPAVAQDYTALDLARDGLPNVQPHITPAEVRFQRPLVVDAGGRPWSEIPGASGGTYSTDGLAQLGKDAGYDSLVVRNVRDMKAVNGPNAPVATTYTALRPGTVFSPTTGERLYTGAGAIGAGAAAAALTQPTEAKADTMEPEGFGDQIVRMMLNQQPAVSGPLPQQAQQPQLGPQDGQPAPPQTFDDHIRNIEQFWAKQPPIQPPSPGPQAELRGRGPGESRDPYAVMDESVEGQLAPYAPVGIPGEGMALNALSGVGRTFANPRVAGPIAAGVGMAAAMPGASDAGDSPMVQLRAQRQALADQQAQVMARLNANADSPGQKYKDAKALQADLQTRIDAIDAKMDAYPKSPEGMREAQELNDKLAAEEADRKAHEPFGEAHPDINAALPIARFGAAYMLPAYLGYRGRRATFAPDSEAGRVGAAVERGRNALAGKTTPLETEAAGRELDEYANREPWRVTEMGRDLKGIGAAGIVGGATAAELTGFPDQYDAKILKPGPDKDAANRRAFGSEMPQTYGPAFLAGAVSGIGGRESSTGFRERKPDYAAARGVGSAIRDRNRLAGDAAPGPRAPDEPPFDLPPALQSPREIYGPGATEEPREFGPGHPNYRPRAGEGAPNPGHFASTKKK